jgi:hypothetical protein
VQVTGQFADLTPTVRAQLRDEQAEHDLFLAAFTPEETFTYAPTLTRFTLRYLLEARSITHKPLTVSAVCMDDVKIKR